MKNKTVWAERYEVAPPEGERGYSVLKCVVTRFKHDGKVRYLRSFTYIANTWDEDCEEKPFETPQFTGAEWLYPANMTFAEVIRATIATFDNAKYTFNQVVATLRAGD